MWTAPELLRMPVSSKPRNGTARGDIYSFGIICKEIIYRDLPYGDDSSILEPKGKKYISTLICPHHYKSDYITTCMHKKLDAPSMLQRVPSVWWGEPQPVYSCIVKPLARSRPTESFMHNHLADVTVYYGAALSTVKELIQTGVSFPPVAASSSLKMHAIVIIM